jgi:hypothetical protein
MEYILSKKRTYANKEHPHINFSCKAEKTFLKSMKMILKKKGEDYMKILFRLLRNSLWSYDITDSAR